MLTVSDPELRERVLLISDERHALLEERAKLTHTAENYITPAGKEGAFPNGLVLVGLLISIFAAIFAIKYYAKTSIGFFWLSLLALLFGVCCFFAGHASAGAARKKEAREDDEDEAKIRRKSSSVGAQDPGT